MPHGQKASGQVRGEVEGLGEKRRSPLFPLQAAAIHGAKLRAGKVVGVKEPNLQVKIEA